MTTIIRILSLPARHPYVSKFHDYSKSIRFVNPDTDYFENQGMFNSRYLHAKHPPNTYDLVHIHFSFDHVSLKQFIETLNYFKKHKKPILWTCHSRTTQRIKNYADNRYQKVLFQYADKIISPTRGCSNWIRKNWGLHKNPISVIPLSFMAHPNSVHNIYKKVKKYKNLFTMLVGNFRDNREFVHSITAFLQCEHLKDKRLQIIFKPVPQERQNSNIRHFMHIIKNPRIQVTKQLNISNNTLVKAFVKSHAIILPYLWGTHSGQLELARDCGCHVSISNVGYYREQWNKIILWKCPRNNWPLWEHNYIQSLVRISNLQPSKPAGNIRIHELEQAIDRHIKIYQKLIGTTPINKL